MKKKILTKGDIIAIPLEQNSLGFGQCVSDYNHKSGGFMISIFNFQSNSMTENDIDHAIESKIIFLGYTFDAKIYHKHWHVIGNRVHNINAIQMPFFKLGTPPDEIYLSDYLGNRICKITEYQFNQLPYLSEIAPVRYENALKAYWGYQDWNDSYENMRYSVTLESKIIADKILQNH
ncbi:MAG: hypothetical protein IT269_07255 [Saprospiraceae bacterium]|nr:hypothetical protein [Saprospiraceae bacterium]